MLDRNHFLNYFTKKRKIPNGSVIPEHCRIKIAFLKEKLNNSCFMIDSSEGLTRECLVIERERLVHR